MHVYSLSILTPQKVVFEGSVYSVHVPGYDGYLEVLAHHAPLISRLKSGKLVVVDPQEHSIVYTISDGFLEVSNNKAIIMVGAIE